jgi:hypothetical protein
MKGERITLRDALDAYHKKWTLAFVNGGIDYRTWCEKMDTYHFLRRTYFPPVNF